jgi:uncharacterized membrane protein
LSGGVVWINGVPTVLSYPGGGLVASSMAQGCNATGTIVAGTGYNTQGAVTHAMRWTNNQVAVLNPLPGDTSATAIAMSADGKIVLGTSGSNMVCWINDYIDCELIGSGFMPTGISANGKTVIGFQIPGAAAIPTMWTLNGSQFEKQTLPLPVGHANGFPHGISADGQIIVGWTYVGGNNTKNHAVYWQDGKVTLLEPASEAPTSIAFVAAHNASSIVIFGTRGLGNGGFFRWTPSKGIEMVADLLTAAGIDVSKWYFEQPTAISTDGTVISGLGQIPAGTQTISYHPFVIQLPLSASALA